MFIIFIENNENISDIHPDDPKNGIPKNQIEFKERVLKGPFQPILDIFPKSIFGGAQRSFQKSWYQQFSWLEYSPKDNLSFCFPCRMFSGTQDLILNILNGYIQKFDIKIGKWLPLNSIFIKNLNII